MMAKRPELERARALLARHGVQCRSSRARRSEGILRVADEDAARARRLLQAELGREGVVSASEAAWFRCHECRAPLSLGATVCASCRSRVADDHGG